MAHARECYPARPSPLAVKELTCKETIRLICEYLEGRLVPGVARDLRCHLDLCRDCRMVLEAARTTLEIDFDGEPLVHQKPQVA